MGTLLKESDLKPIAKILVQSKVFCGNISQFPEFLLIPYDLECELPKNIDLLQHTLDLLHLFVTYHQEQATFENLIKVLIEKNLNKTAVRIKSLMDEHKRSDGRIKYFSRISGINQTLMEASSESEESSHQSPTPTLTPSPIPNDLEADQEL